jgi:F-type H+-transporting ATPase subunit epsilon
MSNATSQSSLRVVVVTPEATLLDEAADFVALPLFDGELGVAFDHSPMIGRLGYGELRIRQGAVEKRLYVDGGFVQVADNIVSVLTNRAVEAKDLDVATAKAQLEALIAQRAPTDEEEAIRERAMLQARGQIRTAAKAK